MQVYLVHGPFGIEKDMGPCIRGVGAQVRCDCGAVFDVPIGQIEDEAIVTCPLCRDQIQLRYNPGTPK